MSGDAGTAGSTRSIDRSRRPGATRIDRLGYSQCVHWRLGNRTGEGLPGLRRVVLPLARFDEAFDALMA